MSIDGVCVLMYHALLDASGGCADADRHYAVTRLTLNRHLAMMRESHLQPSSLMRLLVNGPKTSRVALTFDDGHVSNMEAAQDIAEQSGSADFFVNPERVGKQHYLSWTALREMADMGMSIQSHGHTHRYFNEMTDVEAAEELRRSKDEIEQHIGLPVTIFAPPGGRLTSRVPMIAGRLGYKAICSSRVGVWRTGSSALNIPRFAVLLGTSDEQLRRWIRQDRLEVLKLSMRQGGLNAMKRLLGNHGYERFRAAALRRSTDVSGSGTST
jgi:peptidoglycan/xylan/chitin deacetylase (PgdA/CDA1 family)